MADPKDPSNLRRVLLESPDQLKTGFELAKNANVEGKFTQVVISGMGGSALPANLLRTYLNEAYSRKKQKPTPVFANRYYSLPPESYDSSLNIICSHSGNTEETISSFNEALKNNLPCIGISSGGKIEEICKANGITHIKLPIPYPNFQPRTATGHIFASMLQILINHGLAPDEVALLLNQAEQLRSEIADIENQGKTLAHKLAGKTPVVYSNAMYKSVAMIWKIKLNENAKTPAFWNFFPELNHNEMIGYTNPQSKFFIIMLRDLNDNRKNINRFEATSGLLRQKGIDVEIIDMKGESVFFKMFQSLAIGDFTSYYLALAYGQDPTPVAMVEDLKHILAGMK